MVPVARWGGEDAFQKQIVRDENKRVLLPANGWRLIEVPLSWAKDFSKQYIIDAIALNLDNPTWLQDRT